MRVIYVISWFDFVILASIFGSIVTDTIIIANIINTLTIMFIIMIISIIIVMIE